MLSCIVTIEREDGSSLVVLVTGDYHPAVPARITGAPEDCEPGEEGSLEVDEVSTPVCNACRTAAHPLHPVQGWQPIALESAHEWQQVQEALAEEWTRREDWKVQDAAEAAAERLADALADRAKER